MWTVLPLLLSIAAQALPTLELSLIDHQREIELSVDQTIDIALERPAADPQQRWILLEPPMQHILAMRKSGEGPRASQDQPQVWRFQSIGAGSQRLRFELRRRGEVRIEAEREFTVLLNINAPVAEQSGASDQR